MVEDRREMWASRVKEEKGAESTESVAATTVGGKTTLGKGMDIHRRTPLPKPRARAKGGMSLNPSIWERGEDDHSFEVRAVRSTSAAGTTTARGVAVSEEVPSKRKLSQDNSFGSCDASFSEKPNSIRRVNTSGDPALRSSMSTWATSGAVRVVPPRSACVQHHTLAGSPGDVPSVPTASSGPLIVLRPQCGFSVCGYCYRRSLGASGISHKMIICGSGHLSGTDCGTAQRHTTHQDAACSESRSATKTGATSSPAIPEDRLTQ